MNEKAFQDFLEQALKLGLGPLVLHQCCWILPAKIVEAHERAGCPGKAQHFDFVVERLRELTN